MNIKIGEKIKFLRKKADVTQDRFAEYLGITPQAISRWESKTAYPDIELIPAIANFFSVSTDELLGVDKTKNQEKINAVYDKIKEYAPRGLHDKKIEVLRKALQEFPNEYGLLSQLAHALSNKAGTTSDAEEKKKLQDEAITIWERIVEDAPGEHHGSLLQLAYAYKNAGNQEKAVETARKLPGLYVTSEVTLANILKDEEKFTQLKSNAIHFTDILSRDYKQLANTKFKDDFDKKLMLYHKAIKVFEVLCEDGDYGFYHERLSDLNWGLFKIYFYANDKENAVNYLAKAAYHGVEFDKDETVENNKLFKHTSIVFEREQSDKSTGNYSRSANNNHCQDLLNRLAAMIKEKRDSDINEIMSDERFKEIHAKLEKYAKIYE